MALTSIIPSSNKVPGIYLQVTLGVGRRSAAGAAKKVLLVGNMLAAGSAAVEVVKDLFSVDDARTFFGGGSELFMMAQAAFAAYPGVTLHAIAVTESAGANATDDVVVSGTATGAGTIEIWIGGRRAVATVAIGDTATVVGASIEAAVNAETDWPVTASNAAGTVTIEAKQNGTKGNDITLRTLKTDAAGITHAAMGLDLASGATADDPQNAIDAVAAVRYDYVVCSNVVSAEIAKYEIATDAKADPLVGIRQRFFYGSRDTIANTVTLSDAINAKRGQCIWHYNGDDTPAEMAAGAAAIHARYLDSDRARPLDGVVIPGLRPQDASADKPLNTELQSALNNGITPLDHDGSSVSIVRSITNYSTDAQGNPDSSVLDVSKVEVPDFMADTLEADFLSTFAGFKLDEDPTDPTGYEVGVATPKGIKDWIYGHLRDHAAGGPNVLLLQRVEEFADQLIVELDAAVDGRANASIPIDVVEGFHQGAFDIRQVG